MTSQSRGRSSQSHQQTPQGASIESYDEHVRRARALLGVTPHLLAARIGAAAEGNDAGLSRHVQNPAGHDPDQLSAALHAIIGWYGQALGETVEVGDASASAAQPGALMGKYLALRTRWEQREAACMVARMNAQAGQAASRMADPGEAARRGAPAQQLCALLVDDASDVLVTVSAFLESFGLKVSRANNADAALLMLATGAPVDLLVSDHTMPGMTGKDLVLEALQQRPQLRAMIITGYPDNKELRGLPDNVVVLPKPFRRMELAARIQTLLAGLGEVAATAASRRSVAVC